MHIVLPVKHNVLLGIIDIKLVLPHMILGVLHVNLVTIVLVLLIDTLVIQVKHIHLIGMLQHVLHVKVVLVVNT